MFKAVILVATLLLAPLASAAINSGSSAPDFTLNGSDGKSYKLSQFKGKTVVLEWFNNDCPYVKKFYDTKTMQTLQAEQKAKGVVWLTIVSSAAGKEGHVDAAGAQAIYKERGMASHTILLDDKGAVGKLYGAKTTPHMYVIDMSGKLAYQGAIDDRPSAQPKSLQGAQNYVTAALTALEKKEPVKTASSTPYGCSVKY